MSSFVISTNVTASQSLGATEVGMVAASGSVLSPVGAAISMAGDARLITYGGIAATSANALSLSAVGATSVTIAQTGSVIAGGMDFAAIGGSFAGSFGLLNAGLIVGGQGISLTAATAGSQINIGNSGSLQGLGNADGAALGLALNATSRAVITNSGTLSTAGIGATISATGNGTVTLTNTGQLLNASVTEAAIQVAGALTLRNSGLIEGNVIASLSANIFNSGKIDGNIALSSNNDVVRVSGIVMGDVTLGNGTNVFWQTGGRVMGTVSGGAGADTYHVDRGDTVIVDTAGGYDWIYASCSFRLPPQVEKLTLIGSTGMMGIGNGIGNWIIGDAGDDVLRGLAGPDSLDGGNGNNRLNGGMGSDTLVAGDGDDLLFGAAGDDVICAGYGNDTLNGGLGRDTLRFDLITDPAGVTANLGTNTYRWADMGLITVSGFENLSATAQADRLTGDAFANVLWGLGGADLLLGGAGSDTLNGGARADTLEGGTDADTFVYGALSDSTAALGIDLIRDFTPGEDKIDLRLIDAVPGGADDAFAFIGQAAFSGTGAALRWFQDGANSTTVIELRTAGAAGVEMQITLTGLLTLGAGDFLL